VAKYPKWLPLAVLVGLFLFGFALCGFYVLLANKFCPVESIPAVSPLRHLLSNDRDRGEQQRGQGGKWRSAYDHDHFGYARAALTFAQAPTKETERQHQAADEHGKPYSWIVKFFCEAKAADIALVFFTYGLMIVTGWLAWVTLKLWMAGEKQMALIEQNAAQQTADMKAAIIVAQQTAEAAKQQAAIAKIGVIDLERAYLAASPTQIQRSDQGGAVVYLQVHNTGRTGAVITKIYTEYSQTPPLGDVPQYVHGDEAITDLSIAAGREDTLWPFRCVSHFSGNQFFWGYVEYRDIFKNTYKSRFCAAIFPPERAQSDTGEVLTGRYQIAGSDGWRDCD
jgi:hypothetical protein